MKHLRVCLDLCMRVCVYMVQICTDWLSKYGCESMICPFIFVRGAYVSACFGLIIIPGKAGRVTLICSN